MADSDVVEAEATQNTEAKASVTAPPVVAAKPQEAEAAKTGDKPETKVAEKAEVKTEAKTEAKPDASKDAKDKPAEPEKPKAPESYTFKDENGKVIESKAITAFAEIAKAQGWTQEVADQQLGALAQGLRDSHTAQVEKWRAEALADKEIGGEKLPETIANAKKAMTAVGVGESYLKTLDETGLGNHVELIRAWAKVWKAVGPDGFTAGVRAPGRPGLGTGNPNDTSVAALAQAFYGDAKQ